LGADAPLAFTALSISVAANFNGAESAGVMVIVACIVATNSSEKKTGTYREKFIS